MDKKEGRGNKSNSSRWKAAYFEDFGKYYAMLNFSSAQGCWESIYEISRETFERLGTFENDDYRSEDLIRKGKRIYRYENERNYPEPLELSYDDNWQIIERMLLDN